MKNQTLLKTCSYQEAYPYKASKWLKHQFLIDPTEMRSLLEALTDCHIFQIGTVCPMKNIEVKKEDFLDYYTQYVEDLKNGRLPSNPEYNRIFSSAITGSLEDLYAIALENEQAIVRIARPIVQLQLHTMDYTANDRQFHPMIFGKDTIHWGLQISYPQIFQDSVTCELSTVLDSDQFPNNKVFRTIQKWIRENTIPTPFVIVADEKEEKVNIPVRLGKNCLAWINQHPQLNLKGLKVCA